MIHFSRFLNYIYDLIFFTHVYMFLYVYMNMWMCTWRGQKKVLEVQVSGVTSSCMPPKMCTGNSAWIFYTESTPNAESSLQSLARLYFI